MQATMILPAAAGFCLAAYLFITATNRPIKAKWVAPAALCAIFLLFSLFTIQQEGIWQFWQNHSQNYWGNQVWIDLLLAIGIAWTFILPEARRLNMALVPWTVAILLTGCIGVLAMVARLLWLQGRDAA